MVNLHTAITPLVENSWQDQETGRAAFLPRGGFVKRRRPLLTACYLPLLRGGLVAGALAYSGHLIRPVAAASGRSFSGYIPVRAMLLSVITADKAAGAFDGVALPRVTVSGYFRGGPRTAAGIGAGVGLMVFGARRSGVSLPAARALHIL